MLKKTLPVVALLLAPIFLMGFFAVATDYRKVGFKEIQRGFKKLYKPTNLHEVIKLKNVSVHIVGDRKFFKWNRASQYGSPVQGYATRKNEIWVFGTTVKGRIILNQAILGHEFNHLLQFNHPQIHNPDLLDDIGA
jgi:hypothetical protein